MRRAWVLVLIAALAGCSDPTSHVSQGPDLSWHARAAAPFPDHTGSALVEVGNRLIVLGGSRSLDCSGMMSCPIGAEVRRMAAYDPAHDRWSRLPDLPPGISSQPRVTVLGDKLIADGPGEGDPGHVWVFDLSARRWSPYQPPPLDPVNADRLTAHGHAVYLLTATTDPARPVQRLDLRTGTWSVLTREGLGEATTRSIFWTEAGLVSAGYDSSAGTPIQAVARYANGTWHRYDAPPRAARPAPYVLWNGMIVIAAPPYGGAQGLDPISGDWLRVPSAAVRSAFLPDGRPAIPRGDTEGMVVFDHTRLYELSGHSQLREQPLNLQ